MTLEMQEKGNMKGRERLRRQSTKNNRKSHDNS